MVIPTVNPQVSDHIETWDTYVDRACRNLKEGKFPEVVNGLDAYIKHFFPQYQKDTGLEIFFPKWLAAFKVALFRDIPMKLKMLVLNRLVHDFPSQDVFDIVLEFLGSIAPDDLEVVKKILQDVPDLLNDQSMVIYFASS